MLPRRKTSLAYFAVVAVGPVVIAPIPLMAAAIALALRNPICENGWQDAPEPSPGTVFPHVCHARHFGSYLCFLKKETPKPTLSCSIVSGGFGASGISPLSGSACAAWARGSDRWPSVRPRCSTDPGGRSRADCLCGACDSLPVPLIPSESPGRISLLTTSPTGDTP